MTENQLQEYCKALHIPTMFLVYEERYGNNSEVTNFLNDALSAEFQAQKVNRQMRSLKQAGFPTVKRFEDLILDALPEDGRQSIPDLKSLEFLKERKNLILIGNSGTGKTHCAIATGVQACLHEYKVMFRTAVMLINELYKLKSRAGCHSLLKR